MAAAGPERHTSIFFGPREALPSGRHGLDREEVRRIQRERLLRAFTELLAEHGFARLRIAWVCERAGVSNRTFYELFADKEDCLCAAYDRYIEVLRREGTAGGVPASDSWRVLMARTLDVYFGVLAADPGVGRAFDAELAAIGPRVGERQRSALHRFARNRMAGERRLRRSDPHLLKRPFTVHLGAIQAQRVLAREALETDSAPDFRRLRADLLEWFVSSWYEEGEMS